jgi:glutaredoxin
MAALAVALAAGATELPSLPPVEHAPGGETIVHVYFFSSEACPHCARADAFLAQLADEHAWLRVHHLEVVRNAENRALYLRLARQLGQQARHVPAFAFCDTLRVGFPEEDPPGAGLRAALEGCRRQRATGAGGGEAAEGRPGPIAIPGLGRLDPETASLPLFTVVIAALDGFNPCAFFVLLVLLSLLVHARSRTRILLVGGVFVVCSGVFYFAFMAAWLNAFLLWGELQLLTRLAGVVAVALAVVNVKDFFWPGRGPSLSIPERARPDLFRRMRSLLTATSTPSVLLGAAVLAMAANSYELLCTAGFPLVFTRVLTLRELPTSTYYLYLALYNLVYIVPLATLVGVFAWTLGSRKLGEEEGRILKLLSGLMLLGLGAVLVTAPTLLQRPLVAVALLAAALATTAALIAVRRLARR